MPPTLSSLSDIVANTVWYRQSLNSQEVKWTMETMTAAAATDEQRPQLAIIFPKWIGTVRIHPKNNQGLQATSSSSYLWVLTLTLISIDLIPRVSQLRYGSITIFPIIEKKPSFWKHCTLKKWENRIGFIGPVSGTTGWKNLCLPALTSEA